MLVLFGLLVMATIASPRVVDFPNLDLPNLDISLPDLNLPNLDDLEFGAKAMAYNCRSDGQCSTCPESTRHLAWTSASVLGTTLFNRTKIQCAKDCTENIECRDHPLGRYCACVPRNLCLRGSACEECEEDAITTVFGQRFCCEGCRKSTVSIHVDPPYVLIPTCVCNGP